MIQESIRDVLRSNLLEARPIYVNKASLKRLAVSIYNTLYKKLFKPFYVKGKDRAVSSLFTRGSMPSLHRIEFTELSGPLKGIKRQLPISFRCGGVGDFTRKYIYGGGVETRISRGQKFKLGVYIQLADASILSVVRDKEQFIDELYSVLIHEATHLADKLENYATGDIEDTRVYYNTPSEVRAFMQQIVDETVKEAKSAAKDLDGFTDTQQLVDISLEQSKTWIRVRHYLNERNKQKILKAVYSAIDRADFPSRYSDEG